MSTKIFDGFSVATSSAVELLALVNKFRPWVHKQEQQMLDTFIAATGKGIAEAMTLWWAIQDRTVDKGLRFPGVDTNFELVFFPDGDRFLGIMRCEHAAWRQEWLKQPGVSEYAYFNHTDRPEEYSEQEWDSRYDAWTRVLGNHSYSEVGLRIRVNREGGPIPDFKRLSRKDEPAPASAA